MFFKLLSLKIAVLLCVWVIIPMPHNNAHANPADWRQDHTIKMGQKLSIIIKNENELSGIYTVNQNGTIDMPLIGTVHIEHKTQREAEILLITKYKDGYLINPFITVQALTQSTDHPPLALHRDTIEQSANNANITPASGLSDTYTKTIYILGGVENPGRYQLPQDAHHVLQTIALAGGYARHANKRKFRVLRDEEKFSFTVHDTQTPYTPEDGDIIIIDKRYFWTRNGNP